MRHKSSHDLVQVWSSGWCSMKGDDHVSKKESAKGESWAEDSDCPRFDQKLIFAERDSN